MDKIEKIIKDDLSYGDESGELDIDSILRGTHARIKKRSIRRKTIYASPVVLLLIMTIYTIFPQNGGELVAPGGELLIAGWEDSWTEIDGVEVDETSDRELYEESVDYLIDDQYLSYLSDADELLDESDLEAFMGYLKEA